MAPCVRWMTTLEVHVNNNPGVGKLADRGEISVSWSLSEYFGLFLERMRRQPGLSLTLIVCVSLWRDCLHRNSAASLPFPTALPRRHISAIEL